MKSKIKEDALATSSLFDEDIAARYDQWFLSPQGRYVESVENALFLYLLRPSSGKRVLDIGCGTGNHMLLLKQMGLDVTGIDPSEPMLRVAREKLGPGAHLVPGVAEDLPFDDNDFDMVIFMTSLEFCQSPAEALAEAFRVARECVFIGTINRLSLLGISYKLRGILNSNVLYSRARLFTIWELKSMIRMIVGNSTIKWGSVLWVPPSLHQWDRRLSSWMPRMRNPIGGFLAVRVDILYTYRALMQPLEQRLLNSSGIKPQPGTLADTARR